ncbi:ABC transporter substrate-binding protein [Roseobacter sp. HKCCD9010]|uniref:ABC transporter substrate-binding protein n=1 Tax=unclassified Roseobacter TaxID=196798 RepID=UPI001492C532|nr:MULTISPECIES: ABC transporter substrate-binding protein [unclassified Roseobacter]MBF9051940.1 ABC transporter substrate-binding protein [Rhodobacterales bacterium HKCCD4356]NNV13933.1 ABC transporter substrate-binding protein [Roseobacter sp. HKCCD7357]NNV18105.1 ABC transporter substrate-binding protein [Roseobacter sp. HKCCD8768]NNV27565.1 ABC transporter substrate-binding protein [Roseobacter sp. HKCCD8192]NNV31831.1 ABC transporter substrate-binding protein [Roseobacter sp. HKCCD9061]
MSLLSRLTCAALLAFGSPMPLAAQEGSLSISVGFGPTAEVPDPRASYNGWMSNQTGVTETLMGIDYELNLYPRLAESIAQSSPTIWRLTLRDGLVFHDGTPVTAEAVVSAIAPISEEGHPGHNARIANLLDLASMEVEGERVVVFETNTPNAAFPWSLSEPGIAIVGPVSAAFPINGTGPYIFREAIPEQLYRVEANSNYRLGIPGLAEIRVVVVPDPSASALAFEAGEIDLVINYPEADYARIVETGAQGFAAPTARLYFYTINARSGPMANPLIRQAVSLAIDRQGVVDAVLSGVGGEPAGTVFPAGMGWATDVEPTYDPVRAEELLAAAGAVKEGGVWMLDGAPLEIDIVTYSSRAALPPTAELTQAFLQAIGVAANVRVGEWGASGDLIAEGEADLFLQAWITTPQGDPGAVLETLLSSEGASNPGGYANTELDQLLAAGRTTFDQAEREGIFDRVQEIIAAEAVLIPVFHVSQVSVSVPGLEGYAVHPTETYWVTHETTLTE